jgi:hypothetical protein
MISCAHTLFAMMAMNQHQCLSFERFFHIRNFLPVPPTAEEWTFALRDLILEKRAAINPNGTISWNDELYFTPCTISEAIRRCEDNNVNRTFIDLFLKEQSTEYDR